MRHWSRSSSGRLNRVPQSLSSLVSMAEQRIENPVDQDENASQHGDLNHPRTLREFMNPTRQDHYLSLLSPQMQHVSISNQVSFNSYSLFTV